MGCGSSATPSVVDDQLGTNGKAARVPAARPRPTPAGQEAAREDDDIPTEVLPESEPPAPIKPPLAFEILLDSDKEDVEGEGGLVKKHPPRPPPRLQRMHPSEAPPSLEELQEKMESAEKRRLQILQNRIASATKASRQPLRIPMEEKDEPIDLMVGENDDLQHAKSVTELKNTINLEGHGVTL